MIMNLKSDEKGFTLVELSIVMIIIGLLIGGILKGQELILNARIASLISKSKNIDAAVLSFRDVYQNLPGDLPNPSVLIQNCPSASICGQTISPVFGTVGDFKINPKPGQNSATVYENVAAWAQLAAADLVSGVQPQSLVSETTISEGVTHPEAGIFGQIYLGYVYDGCLDGYPDCTAPYGHYLLIHNGVYAAPSAATNSALAPSSLANNGTATMTPGVAQRIDKKIDDGTPKTGSVLAMGSVGSNDWNCFSATATGTEYNTMISGNICGIYIRIQP